MKEECLINGCIACKLAEKCPLENACRKCECAKTPFSKDLCCLLTYLQELAKEVYEQETRLPRFSYAETLFNLLWIFRGAIERTAETIFDFDEAKKNFSNFEMCRQQLQITIGIANATFLKKPLALLTFAAQQHDIEMLGADVFTTPPN